MAARWALCNASAASTEADSTAPEAWRISIGSTWRATPCTPRDASARALRGSHRGPSGRGAITSRPASLGASLHVLPVAAEHVQFSLVVAGGAFENRSEEHTSELQSRGHLVCRLLLEK